MLIVFSGLDGAGKSTQIDILQSKLRAQGKHVQYLWTRGGYTWLFETLKRILRRLTDKRAIPSSGPSKRRTQAFSHPFVRKFWLWLAILDLVWVYGWQIRVWTLQHKAIICDRYLWDTLVDFRLNFPQEKVESWWLWRFLAWVTPTPDAAFLMLIPVEESLRRSDIKGEPFRDPPEVLTQRLEQYQNLVKNDYWHVLDGRQAIDLLADEIWAVLEQSL